MNIILLKNLSKYKHKTNVITITKFALYSGVAYTTAQKFIESCIKYGLIIRKNNVFIISLKINHYKSITKHTDRYLKLWAKRYQKNQYPVVHPDIIYRKLCRRRDKNENNCNDNYISIKNEKNHDNAHMRMREDFYLKLLNQIAERHLQTPDYFDMLMERSIKLINAAPRRLTAYKTAMVIDWLKNPYKISVFQRQIAKQVPGIISEAKKYVEDVMRYKHIKFKQSYLAYTAYDWYSNPTHRDTAKRVISRYDARIDIENREIQKTAARREQNAANRRNISDFESWWNQLDKSEQDRRKNQIRSELIESGTNPQFIMNFMVMEIIRDRLGRSLE
jgi:hypothetical protein